MKKIKINSTLPPRVIIYTHNPQIQDFIIFFTIIFAKFHIHELDMAKSNETYLDKSTGLIIFVLAFAAAAAHRQNLARRGGAINKRGRTHLHLTNPHSTK